MAETTNGYLKRGIIPGIAITLGTTGERLGEILSYCLEIGLFEESDAGIFNDKMLDHKDYRKERSRSGKSGAKARWEDGRANTPSNTPPNGSAIAQPLAQPIAINKEINKEKQASKETNNPKTLNAALDSIVAQLATLNPQHTPAELKRAYERYKKLHLPPATSEVAAFNGWLKKNPGATLSEKELMEMEVGGEVY